MNQEQPKLTDLDTGKTSRKIKWLITSVWLFGLTSFGKVWGESRWYAFHPSYLPLCLLLLALMVTTSIAFVYGLWRLTCGPHRARWILITVAVVAPLGCWAYVGYTAHSNSARRWIPNTFSMRSAQVLGAALMCAEADFRYSHRLETDHIVMFYNDLETPEEDLAAMEQHLVRLEQLLGGEIGRQIYWIRGPLLGRSFLSYHGLSLGSDSSPDPSGDYRGDRHELAHAALDWFRTPASDPPYLLHEGWAMSQCGDEPKELASAAANAKLEDPSLGIRELFAPEWYYRDSGPVYSFGGAFVDFLVRTRGGKKFRQFYTECTPDNIDAKCQERFGTDLENLETEFWQDVNRTRENQ